MPVDGARVAGILNAVEHQHQTLSPEYAVQRPDGQFHQRDDALAALRCRDGLEKSVRQDQRPQHAFGARLRLRRFRYQDGGHLATAPQGFFQQVESFRDAETFGCQAAAADGPAQFFHQRIGRAGDAFGSRSRNHVLKCFQVPPE